MHAWVDVRAIGLIAALLFAACAGGARSSESTEEPEPQFAPDAVGGASNTGGVNFPPATGNQGTAAAEPPAQTPAAALSRATYTGSYCWKRDSNTEIRYTVSFGGEGTAPQLSVRIEGRRWGEPTFQDWFSVTETAATFETATAAGNVVAAQLDDASAPRSISLRHEVAQEIQGSADTYVETHVIPLTEGEESSNPPCERKTP